MKLGEKIKFLRKQKNISQEVLANYLGVSFQAVSKWENESTMPDVTLIPAIASFFRVSTDELFDFNVFETEKQVQAICYEAGRYRCSDSEKSEQILRDGLKRFPGNETILNNLLYTMDYETRSQEVIDLCSALIEGSSLDDVKYDACRILATCYRKIGRYELIQPTLEKIPELYFTKLGLDAVLLDGEDSYRAASKQKYLSAESLVDMLLCLAKHWSALGVSEKAGKQLTIAKKIIDAFEGDDLESKYFRCTVAESLETQRKEIEDLLSEG